MRVLRLVKPRFTNFSTSAKPLTGSSPLLRGEITVPLYTSLRAIVALGNAEVCPLRGPVKTAPQFPHLGHRLSVSGHGWVVCDGGVVGGGGDSTFTEGA